MGIRHVDKESTKVMLDSSHFLRDLVLLLRDDAQDARRAAQSSAGHFEKGRQQAYYEVLSLILSQAKAFNLDLKAIGLGDFNPDHEIL